MLWNGNECGKNKINEKFKTTVPSKKVNVYLSSLMMKVLDHVYVLG
jgi:hypothetical protein